MWQCTWSRNQGPLNQVKINQVAKIYNKITLFTRIIKYTDVVNEVNLSSTISVIMQFGFIFSLTSQIFQESTLRGKTMEISDRFQLRNRF